MPPQQPADTDALIEEAREFVEVGASGAGRGLIHRLADALARGREARERLVGFFAALEISPNEYPPTLVEIYEDPKQRAEWAEAQVGRLLVAVGRIATLGEGETFDASRSYFAEAQDLARAALHEAVADAEALASLPPPQGQP